MCMSRFHRVLKVWDPTWAVVEDLDGIRHQVSLLTYPGDLPAVGDWLVVHSGYALAPADPVEASRTAELLAQVECPDEPTEDAGAA